MMRIVVVLLLGSMTACATAQPPAIALKPGEIAGLAGIWNGQVTGSSGHTFPAQLSIQPDGRYVASFGAVSSSGTLRVVDGNLVAEGTRTGPRTGGGMSTMTLREQGGQRRLTGSGRSEFGPFTFELTRQQ